MVLLEQYEALEAKAVKAKLAISNNSERIQHVVADVAAAHAEISPPPSVKGAESEVLIEDLSDACFDTEDEEVEKSEFPEDCVEHVNSGAKKRNQARDFLRSLSEEERRQFLGECALALKMRTLSLVGNDRHGGTVNGKLFAVEAIGVPRLLQCHWEVSVVNHLVLGLVQEKSLTFLIAPLSVQVPSPEMVPLVVLFSSPGPSESARVIDQDELGLLRCLRVHAKLKQESSHLSSGPDG